MSRLAFVALAAALACGSACAADAPAGSAAAQPAGILARSSPADGAVLSSGPEEIVLSFSRPARLLELTVAGSDGSMVPMMITAVEEVEVYSAPLPALKPGAYAVTWRAQSAGQPHQGVIRFTVR